MTEQEFEQKWSATHKIEKVYPKTKKGFSPDLGALGKNQSVAYGDGKTFFYLLTKKEQTSIH